MIDEIKRIFDDIRDAIIEMGGDIDICTSPEAYDEAIKTLAGNNAVLFIPVFKSSQIKPAAPTKEMRANNPTDYPDGGGTPDGLDGNVWMSYTIVSSSSTYVPWTEPLLIKGEEEEAPSYDDATTRTFIICLELPDLNIVPSTPSGGTGNILDEVLEGPIVSTLSNGNTTDAWSTNNNHIQGCYTGMSVGTFLAKDGSQVGEWSEPICINSVRDGKDGKDGRNGVDGQDIEFIYRLCPDEATAHSIVAPESDPDIDDYVPTGWTDSPQGIDSEINRVEIMCTRKKDTETGKGGPFFGPVVWASWGEDGMDGDGIEYIFRVATNAEVTQDQDGVYHLTAPGTWPPTCAEGCANGLLTVARTSAGYTSDAATLAAYQEDEFIPGNDQASLGWDRNGTDDPLDVSTSQPFEFCSKRKYNGETETWSGFSEPVLWNKYYVSSAPVFTSFAFTRSRLNLGAMTLTGGTVNNPLPNTQNYTVNGETERVKGFDSVPDASEYQSAYVDDHNIDVSLATAPVWMTTRIFGSVEPNAQEEDQGWTSPVLMSDNRFFNVEYSASTTIDPSNVNFHLPKFDETINGSKPFIDLADPEGVNESAWRQYCTQHSLGTWGDENDIQDPIWMATCQFVDGEGTDGAITQIRGEDGQSIGTAYAFASVIKGEPVTGYTLSGPATYAANAALVPTVTKKNNVTQNNFTGYDAPQVNQPGYVTGMTTCKFAEEADGSRTKIGEGSNPVLQVDTEDYEIMYSPREFADVAAAKAAIPANFTKSGVDMNPTWQASAEAVGWFDETEDYYNDSTSTYYQKEPIYKAEITGRNNQFNDAHWIVTKVAGEDGEDGIDGAAYEDVYIRTNSDVAPTIVSKPNNYTDSNNHTYLDDDFLPKAQGGTLASETECTATQTGVDFYHQYEGVIKRKKSAPDTNGKRTWLKYSGTMALCAKGSEDGADGSDREGIYLRSDTDPGTPPSSGNGEVSPGAHVANGSVAYSDIVDDWVPNGGGDNPQGVSESNKVEYASYRDKNKITGKWEAFSIARVWSHGGKDGKDGDGVQYVFKLYANELTNTQLTSFIPTKPQQQDSNGEGLPATNASGDSNANTWTDDPTAVSATGPYCYCSQIKRINGTGGSYEKLALWSKWSADGAQGPQGPQGPSGGRGPIGPKMRMRDWKTTYGTPPVSNVYTDEDGVHGWQCGDNDDDDFYDIAIYPVAENGITISNAAANADRLGRCTQNLPYSTLAGLITTYGADNVHPGTGGHLEQYFTQAVGGDFIATKLLLADKIKANQIDVVGLSTDTLVTTPESDDPQSYLQAQGNTMVLYKTGSPSCIITSDDLATDTNTNVRGVGKSPLNDFVQPSKTAAVHFTRQLGEFRIFNANNSNDEIYSAYPQFFGVRLQGTVDSDKATFGLSHSDSATLSHLYINIINKETGAVQTWLQGGYTQTIYAVEDGASMQFGPNDSVDLCYAGFKLDTSYDERITLQPGWYTMELTGDIMSTAAGILMNNCNNFTMSVVQYGGQATPNAQESNIGWQGYHSPIIIHHQDVTNPQTTEIAGNGFAHVLDSNNYFVLKHPTDIVNNEEVVDDNTLMLEFLANGLFGLQISKNGIKYTTTGPEHGATGNTP